MQKFYPFHQGCLSLTLTLSGGERLTSGFIWLLLDPSSGLACKVPCSDCNTPPTPLQTPARVPLCFWLVFFIAHITSSSPGGLALACFLVSIRALPDPRVPEDRCSATVCSTYTTFDHVCGHQAI